MENAITAWLSIQLNASSHLGPTKNCFLVPFGPLLYRRPHDFLDHTSHCVIKCNSDVHLTIIICGCKKLPSSSYTN